MRSKRVLRKGSLPRWDRLASPVLLGLAAWLAFPAVPSQGDLTDLFAGLDGSSESWRMVITQSPAGSLHTASLAFPGGSRVLGGDAGIALPDGRTVALADKDKPGEGTPDEDRINRSEKKGRIVAVMPMLPPKAFSAGSILERSSSLTRPVQDEDEMTAFVKVDNGEQLNPQPVEVAEFYFRKDEVKEKSLPPMIASLVTNDHADILATAYASSAPDFSRQSPFDAILTKPDTGRFIPPIGPEDHAWAANPLPADSFSPKQQQCLASGVYFEARGESVRGQAAVAQVILNRVRNPAYPDTICDVVYQNEDWRNRCQFSFACDNIKDRIRSVDHWKTAREVAMAVTAGRIWMPEVGSATHYHATYVRPNWAKTMKKVGRIGLHVFYRTYGGGWS
ncbi:cell wall hydrolase [Aliirhizobium smilacinae]|uniref:Cell wall hydrolase n=1 Tax=Aliirhizobium smilacinae TaxID=1395944 RepID=A0A5C4XQT5_9HYPH|nr:cell wall hydrolase [Rhizobium smilacinae]TNM65956.1 cell wall hydrolase [Rhizobium smilacinae]